VSKEIDKYNKRNVDTKLKKLIAIGRQWFKSENANVRPVYYEYDEHSKTITLGYELESGEKEHTVFHIDNLDTKISLFSAPRISPVSDKTESDSNSLATKENTNTQTNTNNTMANDNTSDVDEETKSDKNNFNELRKLLFEAIRKVADNKMTAEEAKSMAQLAQTVINSAKTEMEYIKLVGKPNEKTIKMLESGNNTKQ